MRYTIQSRGNGKTLRLPDAGPMPEGTFPDVVKSAGKEKRSVQESICYKALQIIQTMFRYEQGYADMPSEERLEQRKEMLPHWLTHSLRI